MQQFLHKIFLLGAPVLLLLLSVNYFGDAAHLFDEEYEQRIVEILESGSNVTNIFNYNDRIIQQELIAGITQSPEVLMVGSSRTMLINSTFFPEPTVMRNHSVAGASLEDLIAIYQLYKERGLIPQKMIIGIDPWTFNARNEQERWRSLAEAYHNFTGQAEGGQFQFQYGQLFSASYFQASLKSLFQGDPQPRAVSGMYHDANTKLTDGALVYDNHRRLAIPEEVDLEVKRYIAGNIYSIEHFEGVSEEGKAEFQQLINDILAHRIELSFYLAPYHPEVYAVVSSKTKYRPVLETEDYIRAFAQRKGISIYGSFDPELAGLSAADFYDGMHAKENAIKRILKLFLQ